MERTNEIIIEMDSKSQNESFARIAISAFLSPLDPKISELMDIKTAVSEAVTNCIIHGYESNKGKVYLRFYMEGNEVTIEIKDMGIGISNIEKAMEPLYTSKPELERSGMGFTVMESFMDNVSVTSEPGKGTVVIMSKKISRP